MMISDRHFAIEAVGGLDTGAREVAAALSYYDPSLSVFRVTKAGQVLGDLRPGARVVVSDDVATTGMSLLKATAAVRSCGVQVVAAFVVVDRKEGAEKLLASHGISLISLLTFTAEDSLSLR
jgi:orotate phosphoribosyltransferase